MRPFHLGLRHLNREQGCRQPNVEVPAVTFHRDSVVARLEMCVCTEPEAGFSHLRPLFLSAGWTSLPGLPPLIENVIFKSPRLRAGTSMDQSLDLAALGLNQIS